MKKFLCIVFIFSALVSVALAQEKPFLYDIKLIRSGDELGVRVQWKKPEKKGLETRVFFLTDRKIAKENVVKVVSTYKDHYDVIGDTLRELSGRKIYVIAVQGKKASNLKSFIVDDELLEKYAWGIFYVASVGYFQSKTDEGVEINEFQNSPLSLGLFYSQIKRHKNNLSGSLYLSYFYPIENSETGKDIQLPLEWGGNIYKNLSLTDYSGFYYGIDYEEFAAVDFDTFLETDFEEIPNQKMLYGTVGYYHASFLFNRLAMIKASVSHSLYNFYQSEDLTPYKGIKGIVYTQFSLSRNYYLHLFFKQHILTGNGELLVSRIGAGFGIKF